MKYIYSLACLILYLMSHAQQLDPVIEQSIEKRIEYGLNESIVIAIQDQGKSYYHNYGRSSADGQSVNEHSTYEIGSISKTFTAILLADQVHKGNMKLDDPISKYLPDGVKVPRYNHQVITLGHLSDHTSSLPRMPDNFDPTDPANPYVDYTVKDMYEFLSSCELDRPIGSEFEYSNLAQGLLGHILARESGMSYEKLMRQVICMPLGMEETSTGLTKDMKRNLALGHSMGAVVPNWDLGMLAGAGGIRSSAHDMLLFIKAQMKKHPEALAPAMVLTHQKRHDYGPGVGLGWFIDDKTDKTIISHGGATGGYRAWAGFIPSTNKAVVIMTNSTEDVTDLGLKILDSSRELKEIAKPFEADFRKALDEKGIARAMAFYAEYKADDDSPYTINENTMNTLGYRYLPSDVDAALAIFKINVAEFPNSSNVYDSYGEALYKKSIEMYKKSLALNPANDNGRDMLNKMGVEVKKGEELSLNEEVLDSYLGVYHLAPTFSIEITRSGTKLFAQATGQGKLQLFPSSETRFYLKVVDAQIEFYPEIDGSVNKMVLFQNGREMPGKRQ